MLRQRLYKADYIKAGTLEKAISILESRSDVYVLAGGTDLIPALKIGKIQQDSKVLLDVKYIPELRKMQFIEEKVHIGAAFTATEIALSTEKHPALRLLAEAANTLGTWQVRNRATIGGNICNASPAADLAGPLLCADAQVKVVKRGKEKLVKIKDFLRGPGQVELAKDALVTEFILPPLDNDYMCKFIKLTWRKGLDLAICGVSVLGKVLSPNRIKDVRIALTSVAPKPIRLFEVEKLLNDNSFEDLKIDQAITELVLKAISPIDDARASAWYRQRVCPQLTLRALNHLRGLVN